VAALTKEAEVLKEAERQAVAKRASLEEELRCCREALRSAGHEARRLENEADVQRVQFAVRSSVGACGERGVALLLDLGLFVVLVVLGLVVFCARVVRLDCGTMSPLLHLCALTLKSLVCQEFFVGMRVDK
jgi:hypothetical protein